MKKQILNVLLIVGLGSLMPSVLQADLSETVAFQSEKFDCNIDPVACFNTGINYDEGVGTEQDEEKAIEYYKKACQEGKGYIDGCFNVGYALSDHAGIEDWGLATKYYKLAADAGDKKADEMLFNLYLVGGVGLMVDKKKATFFGEKACGKGDGDLLTCQYLANLYTDTLEPSDAYYKKGIELYRVLCNKRRDGNSCEMLKLEEEHQFNEVLSQ